MSSRFLLHLSLACFCSLLPVLGAPSAVRVRTDDPPRTVHVAILMYHYISANPQWPNDILRTHLSVVPKAFAAQLSFLRRAGYTTISLDDLVHAFRNGAALPAKPIILTFDDGYQDFYDNAFPLLSRFNDRATIYIITGKVGHAGYMTWGELRELAQSPLITIGAHTRTHPDLRGLPPWRSWDELEGSKADLERELGRPVRHFAYPSGEYNQTVLDQVAELGFATAVTTREGLSETSDQLLSLMRVRVNGYTGLADLIAGLKGQRTTKHVLPAVTVARRICPSRIAQKLAACATQPPRPRHSSFSAGDR